MTSWLGDSLTLEIERVAHGGHFVAHHEGRVVFVAGALPGETVRVTVTKDKGAKFCFARVNEVLNSSSQRVSHFWEAAQRGAGGAEFGHIHLDYQRELKRQVLRESMVRFASQDCDVAVEQLPGDSETGGLYYRTRLQLQARAGRVGVMRAGSDEFIPVESHPLAVGSITASPWLKAAPIQDGRFALWADSNDAVGWQSAAMRGGSKQLLQRVAGHTFELTPGTFWQAHRAAPELLFDWVSQQVRTALVQSQPERVLELYSGAGLFTAALLTETAELGTEIVSVEQSQQAVADAARSIPESDRVEFWVGDVLEYLRRQKPEADLVFLDPPRSGASGKVTEQVIRVGAKTIIYLACDPVALARDTALLIAAGYELAELRAADLFPHTHHFECLATFAKKG